MSIGSPLQVKDLSKEGNSSDEITSKQQQQLTRKKASAVGATTSAVRGLLLQPLYLWYRTPLKLFRPLRVDYLATARALLPQEILARRVSLRGSTLGMIINAVRQRGWSFVPRYVVQPMLANWMVGFALFTTYTTMLPAAYAQASNQYFIYSRDQLPWHPPFVAGAVAGLAQSVVATPLDSLRIRFEVEDMVSGRYHSWWGFVKSQFSDTGIRGLYRGLKLTMIKDVAGYAGFFGLFEKIKNETIDLYRDMVQAACTADILKSDSDISRLTGARVSELRALLGREPELLESQGWGARSHVVILPVLLLPPILAKPACVLFAGAIAALAYQAIDYPLEQFRALLYSEVASGEIMQQTVSKHFSNINTDTYKQRFERNARIPAQAAPYKVAWKSLIDAALRDYPRSVQGKLHRNIIAVQYLYRGWLGVALRSIPAASVGLVFYELLKSEAIEILT
ncbi:mitochondrial carrier domain-containing protein [Coemansia spiralis]|nr:mitochondrial carrier domain-containing protein [Coemansia spiralis]